MIKSFKTESGIEVPAVTKDQMIEVDRIATEETGPNLFQMMENAGRNIAELIIETLGKNWRTQKIIVLAGTGGNGGGGICSARHLANRGADVKVCVTEPNKLKEVTAYQLHIIKSTNAKIISIDELQKEAPDLIIDSIIGYSLTGEPNGNSLELIKWTSTQLGIKISLDVPSGVNSTTGEAAIHHIKPDITLTLALPKTGLRPEITGELYLADIGITAKVYEKLSLNYQSPFGDNYFVKLLVG
ncbi:NAD(P)H-hydrate epimerase [Ignavibacterium sp.]|uniref:NAD(P)H-hydrate epimerase n=1 Tax=Ignavibacterium sp. TaxID=2651167 RepID=UPI00307F75F8